MAQMAQAIPSGVAAEQFSIARSSIAWSADYWFGVDLESEGGGFLDADALDGPLARARPSASSAARTCASDARMEWSDGEPGLDSCAVIPRPEPIPRHRARTHFLHRF
jgi:hypothetical protein